jgi:poly-gamma-glutamate synthesis protein (capsule biosynthesis protein)
MGARRDGPLTLFLSGDVMLGRGIDQILPHPGDPALRERYMVDARE